MITIAHHTPDLVSQSTATRMNGDQASAYLSGLERLVGTAGEYRGFLSNHGPMALDAMIRLGGARDADTWAERYRRELEPSPPPTGVELTERGWRELVGQPSTEADWVDHYHRAIDQDGWRATLSVWWPRLLPGAAASAAHGLLRTAHATRNLADGLDEPLVLDELAQGLALWASRFQPLPGAPTLGGTLDLESAIARLPRLDRRTPSKGPGIVGRLAALSGLDGFAASLDSWGAPDDSDRALDELVGTASRVVLTQSDNPIAYCHAVTVPAAVRMILPSIPVEHHPASVAASWQLVAALLAAFPPRPSIRPADDSGVARTPGVGRLAHAAVGHADEHVLKLTEACIRQHGLTEDDTLLHTAAAFRDRIPAAHA
jgi:hypothetical protein